jgi:hypothetical protein
MRMRIATGALLLALGNAAWAAEEPFDACVVFTPADAQQALGTPVTAEPVNPKAKRPRVVASCAYFGTKDGKPVEARAQFRFGHEAEISQAFDASKLQLATKPLLLRGADASFWSGKTGQMNVRKGRAWIIVSAGSPKANERQLDPARALAETLAARL